MRRTVFIKMMIAVVAGISAVLGVDLIYTAVAPNGDSWIGFAKEATGIAAGFAVCFRLCPADKRKIALFVFPFALTATVALVFASGNETELYVPRDESWGGHFFKFAAWAVICAYHFILYLIVGAVVYLLYPKWKNNRTPVPQ